MKLKNYVLFDKLFMETCFSLHTKEVPMKVSFPLRKVLEVLEKEEKSINVFREDLAKKYGDPVYKNDEDGKIVEPKQLLNYKFTDENMEKFKNEMNDLINFEFEIPLEEKIKINVNDSKFENLNLSSEKIITLEKIFEFTM